MTVFAFDTNIRQQIKKIVGYANYRIYKPDEVHEMLNGKKELPEKNPEHSVHVPGAWICYCILINPELVRCHYFIILPDVPGKLPDRSEIEYILKEFGIKTPLLDEHILNEGTQIKIILPVED